MDAYARYIALETQCVKTFLPSRMSRTEQCRKLAGFLRGARRGWLRVRQADSMFITEGAARAWVKSNSPLRLKMGLVDVRDVTNNWPDAGQRQASHKGFPGLRVGRLRQRGFMVDGVN